MVRHAIAEAEPTLAPVPASDEHPASERRRIDSLIERHAGARSIDELPPELRENAIIRDIVSMTPAEEARLVATVEAHREAEALYGDDAAAELAALEAGTHPLHRRKPTAS
jgi:hypothetical protein